MKRFSNWFATLLAIIWAIALVGLFLTSFPPFSELMGALVAPFSALPIMLLLIMWVVPNILRKGKLPIESKLLLVFLLCSVIASANSFLIQIPTFKDVTPIHQEIRAYLTLAVGLSFYFVFASFPKDEPALRRTLQWINIGGLILVLTTLPQVYYILIKAPYYPKWIYITTDWLTKRTPYFFYVNRVSGFTYEPSWFAHQMILLFLPLWLASTIAKTSTFRFRILGLSLENIMLLLGSVEFFMSAPRISLVGVLLISIALVVRIHKKFVHNLLHIAISKMKRVPSEIWKQRASVLFGLVLFLTYTILSMGAFWILLKHDARMNDFFLYPPKWKDILGVISLNETALLVLANRMAFFERAVYWFTGLHVFNQYPWLGVGLGNAGFYFLQKVPALGWTSYEILTALNEQVFLPNTKSLFVRLLAETGLVGFSVFMLFLYNLWRSARLLLTSRSSTLRLIGLTGQFAMLAFIGEGFSIDSFAMPYLWVMTGLISAAAFIYRQQLRINVASGNLTTEIPSEVQDKPESGSTKLLPTEP